MISLPPKGDTAKKLGSYFAPLKVEAQSTPNMTVKVSEGSFWTADNEHMEYIGGTSATISAPGSDAKWVLITVKSTGLLNIVNGTASGTPQLPDASSYADELPLAAIFVGDTTTAITNDMIYDLRPLWSIPPDSVSQTQLNDFATITYVDNGLATKAGVAGTANANFTLNVGGANINDSGIYVDRFSGPDVAIRFNETSPVGSPPVATSQWEFTNDGVTWNPIGVAGGSYYTKTDLDGGALDTLYYTRTELQPGGALDVRYYTETEIDAGFAVLSHTHLKADITDLAAQVETINSIPPTAGDVQLGLNELNDVTISGTPANAVIKFTGAGYANTVLVINDLGDVTISAPATNEALMYNGSVFINRVITKSDISGLVDLDYVTIGSMGSGDVQDVYGLKTFVDGVVIETSLTVTGASTSISTTNLFVADPYIDVNFGETGSGVGGGTGTAGLRIDRGPAGSPFLADAIIQWDEAASQWEFGLVGNVSAIADGSVLSSHIANTTVHRTINDAGTGNTDLFSAQKIIADLATKANDVTGTVDRIATLVGDGELQDSGFLLPWTVATVNNGNSPYAVAATEDLLVVDASGGNVIINLHSAGTSRFRPLNIKRTDATGSTVTINRDTADLIDGVTSQNVSGQYTNLTIMNDEVTDWHIL